MTEEYGPPIAVNGKRPKWLKRDAECLQANLTSGDWKTLPEGHVWHWPGVQSIRLAADHPYYQSAEYKASVGIKADELEKAWDEEERWEGDFNRPDLESVIKRLEAAGYTVTPPDSLAGDREFVAGLEEATFCTVTLGEGWRGGAMDEHVVKIMDYLRQNKGRL